MRGDQLWDDAHFAVRRRAAGALLLGMGIVAAFVPAWRAGMADPFIAVREP
jgi:hypothetical protein